MKWDTIIIGAGAGGLASAVLLASQGESVLVLEANSEPGGKIGRSSFEGVEFDTGPSVLTMPDVLRQIFEDAGTSLEAELELIRHERVFQYDFSDGCSLDIFFDPERSEASIRDTLGSEAAAEFSQFLNYAREIWESAAPHFVYGSAPSFSSALRFLPEWRAMLKIDPMRTMEAAIQSQIRSPYLLDLFRRYATYNGSDPRSAPATLNCIAWVELGEGGYGVKGGMFEVAKALTRVAERHGAEFQYQARVERITVTNGRADGVIVNGERLECSRVVSNVEPHHLTTTLAPEMRTTPAPASMSGWTALIKAQRQADRAPHQVLFPSNYIQEFVDIFDQKRSPGEPTIYICAQEKAHERTGWENDECLFVMANAPAESANGGSEDDSLEDKVLATLIERNVIRPTDKIVWKRTPRQLAATYPGSHGSIYGAASNSRFARIPTGPKSSQRARRVVHCWRRCPPRRRSSSLPALGARRCDGDSSDLNRATLAF